MCLSSKSKFALQLREVGTEISLIVSISKAAHTIAVEYKVRIESFADEVRSIGPHICWLMLWIGSDSYAKQ